jgi:hypothetical protein
MILNVQGGVIRQRAVNSLSLSCAAFYQKRSLHFRFLLHLTLLHRCTPCLFNHTQLQRHFSCQWTGARAWQQLRCPFFLHGHAHSDSVRPAVGGCHHLLSCHCLLACCRPACCCPGPSCHAATSAELQAVQRAVPPSLFIQVVPQQWQEHLPTLSSSMVKSLCACTAGVVSLDVYFDTIRSQVMHTTCACMGDCISVCVTRSCCNAELADTSLCQIGRRQPHMTWLLTLKSTLVCGSLISAVCTGL